MPVDEIVDPVNSNAGQRRRKLLEVGGPLVGVLLVILVIIGISYHSYRTTRQGVVSLTRDLLSEQQKRITQEVSDYIGPAPATATVAKDLLTGPVTDEPPTTFLVYAASMLRNVQQVDSFYLADDQGTFWFIDRAPADIANGMEWVHLVKDKDVFRHWYFDRENHLVRTQDTPASRYDPRMRPWYRGAVAHPSLNWSDPYPNKGTGQLIVTAASVLETSNGHRAVFAINISLNRLTDFLASMKIGRSGKAVVVDHEGHIVAGSNMLDIAQKANWDFERMRLDQTTQPVFVRALALFHIYGSGVQGIDIRDTRYAVITASLRKIRPGWILILNAPESDFASFAAVAGRQSLLFSLVIVLLAALLAGFLVRQSRRSERLQYVLDRHRAQTREESRVINEMAGQVNLLDPSRDVPILTQRLAELAEARRVSFWRLVGDGNRLLCEDSYDRDSDTHSMGIELSRQEMEPFYQMLQDGEAVEIGNAGNDERLRAFERIVMRQIGSKSLYIRPVMIHGDVGGMVVLEDAVRPQIVSHIISLVAEVVAIRFAAANSRERPVEDADPAIRPERDGHVRFGDGFLATPIEFEDGSFEAGRYPMVPVATILFQDNASDNPRDVMPVVQKLVLRLQEVARAEGLFSAQVLGNRVVLVGGCSKEPDPDAAWRVADAALSLRESALVTLANADLTPTFRIGLDAGPVLGAILGEAPGTLNLWGETIQTSELLAESAPDTGTIQVSETVYSILRDSYMFRPRGMFFLPRVGITRTFVLAARR